MRTPQWSHYNLWTDPRSRSIGRVGCRINRRSLLTSGLLAISACRVPLLDWTRRAQAQDNVQDKSARPAWRHGVSQFGDLRYPSGFAQFDYVNANAPKGGSVRQTALGTYDNFNMAVAGVKGSLVSNIDLLYDTLLAPALDEASAPMD